MKIARSRPTTLALLVVPVVVACTAVASGDKRDDARVAHAVIIEPAERAHAPTHARAYPARYDARPRSIAR